MAIVLALVIVGWLLAFALGSQAGFDSQLEATPVQSSNIAEVAPTYSKTASAS